ncbi:MAG: DUF4040 domain-containing protein [Spirochaetaceae bacterium]|nr:MAG: DUF4040 domain-containing protein [Spirochaetaceae bacterium]
MNTIVAEAALLLVMALMALLTIQTKILRMAIVYMGIFSLAASLVYVLYRAPDVAIAEAVIGSGLVALLYLSALKRYRVYTIGVVGSDMPNVSDRHILRLERKAVINDIAEFCVEREREPQTVFSQESIDEALLNTNYDIVIEEYEGGIRLYGHDENYLVDELELLFSIRDRDAELEVIRFRAGAGI